MQLRQAPKATDGCLSRMRGQRSRTILRGGRGLRKSSVGNIHRLRPTQHRGSGFLYSPEWGPMMTSWWLAQTISLGYISPVYARKDSNPQPSEPKSDVLSIELRALGCYRISSLYKNGPAPCLYSEIAPLSYYIFYIF